MKKLVLVLAVFLLCGGWSHGRGPETFFVSNSGNDSNNGLTQTTAWATPGKVNSSSFNSGDTVAFNGGQAFSGSISLTQTNAPANLTITSYGAGQATISSGTSNCITAHYFGGLVVNNLECLGNGTTNNAAHGIFASNDLAGNILIAGPAITNSTITGYGGICIFIAAGNGTSGYTNVNISNNSVHDCTGGFDPGPISAVSYCINIGGIGSSVSLSAADFNGVTVNNNTVFNCNGFTSATRPSGGGISIAVATNMVAQNNLVHDTGSTSNVTGAGPTGFIIFIANNAVVSFNEIYNSHSVSSVDGEALNPCCLTGNSIVEYNYIHGATSNAYILLDDGGGPSSPTFRFNIVDGAGTSNVTISGSGVNATIYNNTFSGSVTNGCSAGGSITETIANNIFNFPTGGSFLVLSNTGCSSATFNVTGNDYYFGSGSFSATVNGTTYTSLASFQAAGFEKVSGSPVGTTANPNLTGTFPAGNCGGYNGTCPTAYDLTTASPAGKGNGLNLNTIYGYNVGTQDFYGNAVTNTTLPIGAAANK